jgi:hypothetical protein
MTTPVCNACDQLDDFVHQNQAGYCSDCMGEAEAELANRLDSGDIDFPTYQAEFEALHA